MMTARMSDEDIFFAIAELEIEDDKLEGEIACREGRREEIASEIASLRATLAARDAAAYADAVDLREI